MQMRSGGRACQKKRCAGQASTPKRSVHCTPLHPLHTPCGPVWLVGLAPAFPPLSPLIAHLIPHSQALLGYNGVACQCLRNHSCLVLNASQLGFEVPGSYKWRIQGLRIKDYYYFISMETTFIFLIFSQGPGAWLYHTTEHFRPGIFTLCYYYRRVVETQLPPAPQTPFLPYKHRTS